MLLSLYYSTLVPQSLYNSTSVTTPACLLSSSVQPLHHQYITPSSPCILPIHIFQNRPLHRASRISVYCPFFYHSTLSFLLLFSPYCHQLYSYFLTTLSFFFLCICFVSMPLPFGNFVILL